MIFSKIKKILNNNEGMALIVALCVSTFIMALSLAVIYSTAQVSSNINNKKLREEAQWQARTFADQIKAHIVSKDDNDPSRETDIYNKLELFCDNAVTGQVYKFTYDQSDDLSEFFGDITVNLVKQTSKSARGELDDPDADWADKGSELTNYVAENVAYDIELTVIVNMKSGVSAAVTDTYEVNQAYDYDYTFISPSFPSGIACSYDGNKFRTNAGDDLTFAYVNSTSGSGLITMEYANSCRGQLSETCKLVRERSGTFKSDFIFIGRE